MKKFILSAAIFLSAATAFAAPLDRSVREIRDIVSSPELRHVLPANESILTIRRVDRGYLITTNHYQLYVEVLYPKAQSGGEEGSATLRFEEAQKTS